MLWGHHKTFIVYTKKGVEEKKEEKKKHAVPFIYLFWTN
jgi:hypothetical protein